MNEYVNAYKKKRKKTICVYGLLAFATLLVCLLTLLILIVLGLNYIFIIIPMMLSHILLLKFLTKAHKRNLKTINNLLANHLDAESALEAYEQFMHEKKSLDFPYILVGYLKTLLMLGKYDKFVEVYKAYPKYANKIDLRNLKTSILSLQKDSSAYRESLFQHKFSKYRYVNEKLSDGKEELKLSDQTFDLMQLYETKEYRKAIEKIDSICSYNAYNELLFHSYRERCLYHLGEPCSMPDETIYPFSFVVEWKYLLETGEEYHYEKMDELLEVFDHNAKCVQQNIKKLRIGKIAYVILAAIFFVFMTPNENELFNGATSEQNYIDNLKVWDYEAQDLYGFCANRDLAGAIMFGNKIPLEEGSGPGYYITTIDYYIDGFMPMMKLERFPLLYLGGTQIYWMEGDSSTYILVLSDVQGEVVYDGKVINQVKCEKMPRAPLFVEPYAYSFIIDGKYKDGMLTVR